MNVIFYAADGMDDTTEGVSFADDIALHIDVRAYN